MSKTYNYESNCLNSLCKVTVPSSPILLEEATAIKVVLKLYNARTYFWGLGLRGTSRQRLFDRCRLKGERRQRREVEVERALLLFLWLHRKTCARQIPLFPPKFNSEIDTRNFKNIIQRGGREHQLK
ncbi:unnamed protein product [Allacma fusca]|uniref:Uncharacterized protein n=1 Tax=Allacma fusca TaxID=39272 RepID=A0A8J2LI37_9HEXA|nr:unnamed protein product [Allacma fusca]